MCARSPGRTITGIVPGPTSIVPSVAQESSVADDEIRTLASVASPGVVPTSRPHRADVTSAAGRGPGPLEHLRAQTPYAPPPHGVSPRRGSLLSLIRTVSVYFLMITRSGRPSCVRATTLLPDQSTVSRVASSSIAGNPVMAPSSWLSGGWRRDQRSAAGRPAARSARLRRDRARSTRAASALARGCPMMRMQSSPAPGFRTSAAASPLRRCAHGAAGDPRPSASITGIDR
jgi:hypothetical protein